MFGTFFFDLLNDYIDYKMNNVIIQYRLNCPHYKSSVVLAAYLFPVSFHYM